MGYSRDALRGIGWVGATRGFIRGAGLIKLAILVRILTKSQLGTYYIALLVLSLLELLTETGINVFLIQKKDDIGKYISTAWIVSIARGVIICALILVSSPLIVKFFNSPDALPLLLTIAVVPLIRGFINPAVVKFQKELNFRRDFFYRASVFGVDTAVSLIAVYIMRTPMGLVVGLLAGVVYEVALTFLMASPRPSFSYDFGKVREIIGKGKWVTGWMVFEYLYSQGDNIIVGRVLGEAPLGVYRSTYSVSANPIMTELGSLFYQVTFPILVKIRDDSQRLIKAFWRTFIVSGAIVSFASFFLFVFAPFIVQILFGDNWSEAVPLLQILAIVGLLRGIILPFNSLFLASEKQHWVSITTAVSAGGLFIAILPLVSNYGVNGAALAALFGSAIAIPVTLFYYFRLVKSL